VPADIIRKSENRKHKLREVFDRLDSAPVFERALVFYYGWERVGRALTQRNPEDVPAFLGDAHGFRRYLSELAPPRDGRRLRGPEDAGGHKGDRQPDRSVPVSAASVWASLGAGGNKAG
jgi:hypothetical protein